jgi:hypothetical protein
VGLELKPEGYLIQLREQDDGIPIRKLSLVTTKKLEKLSDPHGGDCQEIDNVPGNAKLVKIMSKQGTNKVNTIRLPNRQYTQTGKDTLSELFRVYFLDSLLIDDLDNDRVSKT